VVTALGAQRRQELSVTERIVEFLRPLRMLLLLDNCEHVTTPVAQLVTAVAGRCAGVTVLATSREPLGVDGERVRPVRPLPVPTPGVTDPDAMAGAAAVRLFADRAAAASAGFTLDASNAAAVAELCRGLDGLPLALELAASRLRAMSPAEIVARLDARFGLLSGGRPAAPARHRTLRALVDWSYELLDDAERRAFIRVSVFAGPFTLDAAEAVCPEPDVAGVVAGLVDRSMLTADTRATPTRYTLLETLRAYARERLAATGTEDAVRRMHAEHVVAVAEAADRGLRGPDEAGWVGELVRTTPDLRAAHRWALDHDLGLAGRLSAALAWFAKFHMPPEVSAWAEQVAEAAIRDPDRPVVRLTAVLGVAAAGARTRGDFGRAEELAARATDTADDPDLRYLLMVRSGLALFHGRLDVADRLAERAARLATEVADPAWCAHAVANRSMAAAYRGDPDTARELAGQAAEIAATTGNPTATGWACYAHGEALAGADPPRAIPFFERSRAVATSVQNRYLAGVALVSLAAAQGRLDNPVTALRLLTEVIDHWHAAGNRTQQWTTIRNLVEILVRLGADERAAVLDAGVTGSPTAAPAFGEVAARLDDVRAVLRDRLGPAAFRAAADRGAALDDDEVVALARTTAAEVAASAPSPHS
jgi:predicted ATPase